AIAPALLGSGARALLEPGDNLELSHEEVTLESARLASGKVDQILSTIDAVIALAHRLPASRAELPGRLATVLREARDPQLRINGGRAVLNRFDDSAGAKALLAEGHHDPVPEVRLLVARGLGEPGFAVMAALLDDPRASPGLKERTIRDLGSRFE